MVTKVKEELIFGNKRCRLAAAPSEDKEKCQTCMDNNCKTGNGKDWQRMKEYAVSYKQMRDQYIRGDY